MPRVFFTSDLHLHHKNIMRYCNRPFPSVEEMDEAIINNWNKTVADEDTVYVLGDWVWTFSIGKCAETLKKLKGKKYLILGNHDNPQVYKKMLIDGIILGVYETKKICVEGKTIWLSHYPHRSWNSSAHGAWHLYGHVHGTIPDYGLSTDVGVDKWYFHPVSFEELARYFDERVLDLNANVRDNYKSYKKKYETFFIERYIKRINEDANELEKLTEEELDDDSIPDNYYDCIGDI